MSATGRAGKAWRVAWTGLTLTVVEGVVLGVAVVPAAALLRWSSSWPMILRAMMLAPAYVAFALALMGLSAATTALCGWRTPPHAEMRIADLDWPLLDWVRYMVSTHVVRFCVGDLFRATPVWTLYHRLNGARIGRAVYINSLSVVDDNLLEMGDHVVIGHGVHLSGHTVERGVVRTGAVQLGPDVTIGVGSVVSIGVEIGPGTQVGALSVVPKYQRLEGGAVFGGAPVRRLDQPQVTPISRARGRSRPRGPRGRSRPRDGTAPTPARPPDRA